MARSLHQRLIQELMLVRRELLEELRSISDNQLQFAPAEGMKPYGVLVQEIATMQAETAIILCDGVVPDYAELTKRCAKSTVSGYAELLDSDLQRIVEFIQESTETELCSPLPLEIPWSSYFGAETVEPVELIRWIARHEYYHLAQIVTYRWIEGHNPYGEKGWSS